MVGDGESRASSYVTDPTSPIPSHCASIVVTSTVRVKKQKSYHLQLIQVRFSGKNYGQARRGITAAQYEGYTLQVD